MAHHSVELTVTEEVGVARRSAVVSTGIAWPPGAVRPDTKLEVVGPGDQLLPCQVRTLETWTDGSVRWTGLHFLSDLDAQTSRVFAVRPAETATSAQPSRPATARAIPGDRAVFDSAEAYANHLVDVDVIHHSTQNAFEHGGVRSHGRGHVSRSWARTEAGRVRTSVDTGHMWVEGLLLFSALSNDTRYREAAVGIGDCLLRLVDLGWARPEPGPRNAGWPLIALTALARSTGEDRFLAAARGVADVALERQDADGAWRMRLGFTMSGSGWQNAVLLTGLARLQAVAPDGGTEDALRRGFRALLDHGRHRDGSFTNYDGLMYRNSYDTGLVREALAAAYLHTGDTDHLAAGLLGGRRWYRFGSSGMPIRSLSIAEWRGHLPFLACAWDAGLLEDFVDA